MCQIHHVRFLQLQLKWRFRKKKSFTGFVIQTLLTNSSFLCRAMGIYFLTGICKSLMSHFALLLPSNMELTKVTTVVTDYIT